VTPYPYPYPYPYGKGGQSLEQDEAVGWAVDDGHAPVVQVVVQLAIAPPKLELLKHRPVVHEVQRVEHVVVGLERGMREEGKEGRRGSGSVVGQAVFK
jgi:hypothetical protein